MVVHWFPSLGDPYMIPVSRLFGYYREIVGIEEWKSGDSSTPQAQVQREADAIVKRLGKKGG